MPFDLPSLSKIRNAIFGTTDVADSADQPEPMEGRLVAGRFHILRKIGSGGMGSVYLARQTSMDRDVAIKVLNGDKTRDDDARARFRIEAAAVSRLKNPHTITVYDFGEDEDGELFLVMELLDGRPLSEVFHESGPMDAAMVVAIADQILDSLAEAHAAGVLHRDLKPENIFVHEDAEHRLFVKVLDFGIAKILGTPQPAQTWPGVIFGTPAYMSPEQVMGRVGDQRSDLYALAVVMFELLSGTLPIKGKTPIEIGVKKVRSRPPTLEEVNPGRSYPARASEFLGRALSPNPANRPLTAREFRKAMHETFAMPAAPVVKTEEPPAGRGAPSGAQVVVKIDENRMAAWKYEGDRDTRTRPLRTGKSRRMTAEPADQPAGAGTPDRPGNAILNEAPLSDFDRRRGRRAGRLVGVRCFYDGNSFTATASDLSGTGGFISSPTLPAIGHRITLAFMCPGTREYNISILAEVIRTSPGSTAPGDVRGFAVRWLRMRARGDLACVTRFLDSTIGVEFNSSLPESTSAPQWEYLFEESKFV